MEAGVIGPLPALPGTEPVRAIAGDRVGQLIGRDARRLHPP
jgi:hypothetical protein